MIRREIGRLFAGYGAIACALPYLALKIVWLTGGDLGVADERVIRDGSMIALNVLTAGMDVLAIAIALAFTHRWGLRIPAWLILPTVWVATGLLVKFVAQVPLAFVADALASSSNRPSAGALVQPWVYALVYTEFVGMGIGLAFAFGFHVRSRWASVFTSTLPVTKREPTHEVLVPLAWSAAVVAIAVAALHLAWAFGSTIGVGRALADQRTFVSHLINGIDAAIMLAAVAGVLMLVHHDRRVPFWATLTLTWFGSGFLFAWGLWHVGNVLAGTPLVRGAQGSMTLVNLSSLARLLAGLVIGVVMLSVLAEKRGDEPSSMRAV